MYMQAKISPQSNIYSHITNTCSAIFISVPQNLQSVFIGSSFPTIALFQKPSYLEQISTEEVYL